jgi:endogenous inhibitor of DNA gyrase (YacG/DUF329 family)
VGNAGAADIVAGDEGQSARSAAPRSSGRSRRIDPSAELCQLIDLGAWIEERYVIPANREPPDLKAKTIRAIE